MLVRNADGTYTGGPLDVLLVQHDTGTGLYHAAFYEERLPPGPIRGPEETDHVRLQLKFHRTRGRRSMERALRDLADIPIKVPRRNVWHRPVEVDEAGFEVRIVPNWLATDATAAAA